MNAEQMINQYLDARKGPRLSGESAYDAAIANLSLDIVDEEVLNEQLLKLIWKKLPSSVRSKVDMNKLGEFLKQIEAGFDLMRVARMTGIPVALATELMTAVERSGLL